MDRVTLSEEAQFLQVVFSDFTLANIQYTKQRGVDFLLSLKIKE